MMDRLEARVQPLKLSCSGSTFLSRRRRCPRGENRFDRLCLDDDDDDDDGVCGFFGNASILCGTGFFSFLSFLFFFNLRFYTLVSSFRFN